MAEHKITPHVFISASSDDLRSAREVVKNALLTIGCHPIVQEHFEPDYRSVKDMIRGRLEGCHAMIHLVGKRYGGEPSPESLPPGTPRRSWTQMEYDLAKELGIKTFLFICDEGYPFDVQPDPEPADEIALQEAYRQRLLTGEQLYIEVRDSEELALRISEMKLEAAELRKEAKKSSSRLLTVLVITAVVLAGVFSLLFILNRNDSDLKSGQEQILASVDEMRQSFSGLSAKGGIIPSPTSPEQFYHNARMYELQGDYGNARKAYLKYFTFPVDFLDPHLRFQKFLKVQEGLEGARETYQAITGKTDAISPQLASALLWNREKRISEISLFSQNHPDFAPAYYLLSEDYSVEKVGPQSLEDKRREKELLDQFRSLDRKGEAVKWFLDKSLIAEWRDDAAARLRALESAESALENPLSMTWMSHNSGWNGTVQLGEMATEIFWKKEGDTEFTSTGFTTARNMTTGKPHPQPTIQLPKDAGTTRIQIKYLNLRGEEMGPFDVTFEPVSQSLAQAKNILGMTRTSWVSFRDFDGKTLIYFTHLLGHRGSLSQVYYGVDSEIPQTELPFPAYDKPGYAPIDSDLTIFLEVPEATKFVTAQVVYKDGTRSKIERFNR